MAGAAGPTTPSFDGKATRTGCRALIRWWPLAAVAGLIALGLAVGKGSTALDDWFARAGDERPWLGRLLFFTEPYVVATVAGLLLVVALWRRQWRVAAAVVLTPLVAVAVARAAKVAFGRERSGALAYPSGHTTVAVVVVGLALVVIGVTAWTAAVAASWTVLAVVGQGVTYHYFTDAIGGLLLGSALVCLGAWATGLDTRQPRVRSASQRRLA